MQLLDVLNEYQLMFTNINLIPGLKKKSWIKNRGARIVQQFKDDEDRVIIHELYTYEMINDDREIGNYSRKIQMFNEDGSLIKFPIGDEGAQDYIDTTPDITPDHIADINKVCRNWRMDYLERAAKGLIAYAETVDEPYKSHFTDVGNSIETLLDHYSDQIYKYRSRNFLSMDLENAVLNETDMDILHLLDKFVKPPGTDENFPKGLKTKDSIMFQLTGVLP